MDKLHNIARSVIILDEAQTLPVTLLRPTLATIEDLSLHYGASVVLCTATQPAITATRPDGAPGLIGGLSDVSEIITDPAALYAKLRRTTIKPCLKLTPEQLAGHLSRHDQVLCIVGTRAQARDLFKILSEKTDQTKLFHLSALMCPAHRMERLATIKAALAAGPCRVIATTVVEAGVDIDFPVVWRQMAGLDSIAQAAGRCNREGRLAPEDGIVQLFEVDGWASIRELRPNEDAAREVLRHHSDALGLDAMQAYFEALYDARSQGPRDDLDKHGIVAMHTRYRDFAFPFADVAAVYRLIDTVMEPVIIPFDDAARAALAELADPALPADKIRSIARRLQPYIVNMPKEPFARLEKAGRIVAVNRHRFDEQFMRLGDEAFENIYSDAFGVDWGDATFRAAEANLF